MPFREILSPPSSNVVANLQSPADHSEINEAPLCFRATDTVDEYNAVFPVMPKIFLGD
jgi:hypothetical protein